MNNEEISTSTQPEIISTGEWVLYMLLFSIPLINLILLCIWAFGNQSNPTKTNFGRAGLIWAAILIVFYILFWFVIFGMFSPGMHQGGMGV